MAGMLRKFAWKKRTKATIGIGTLIVFIALVLVAAIASAVILKTAYALKDQAEATGKASVQEVSGGIKVLDITGDRDGAQGWDNGAGNQPNICRLRFLVTVWAGSPGINIAKMRVHWVGPTMSTYLNLNPNSNTVTSATDFASEEVPIKAPRSGDWDPGATPPTYFLIQENMVYIEIELNNVAPNWVDTLPPGSHASVYFIPASGLTVEESFTTPTSYGPNQFIDLTMQ